MELAAIIEALLIASEEPLPSTELARLIRARIAEAEDMLATEIEDGTADDGSTLPEELAALASTDENAITLAVAQLNNCYESTGRAFLCTERAKGWKIFTRPEYADFVRHLFPGRKPSRLSGPAMETLAIVAYRQPVTKASLEAVRGVSCDGMLQKLLDRELVKVGGRAQLPGRPLLYETTDLFFEHFGIKSVDDLPNSNELRSVKLPEPDLELETQEETTNDQSVEDDDAEKADHFEKQLALSAIDQQVTPDASSEEEKDEEGDQ